MSNPGFNIKVRAVSNGFTVHHTHIDGKNEYHKDFICTEDEIKEFLEGLVDRSIDAALEDKA